MSKKSPRIAERICHLQGGGLDPHYLGYFECFNVGEYYEAHDVLEELWLPSRGGADDLFYKGLIQLAGAFVHFKKGRMSPGIALLRLADGNLKRFPRLHHGLNLEQVGHAIEGWIAQATNLDVPRNPLEAGPSPRLVLVKPGGN